MMMMMGGRGNRGRGLCGDENTGEVTAADDADGSGEEERIEGHEVGMKTMGKKRRRLMMMMIMMMTREAKSRMMMKWEKKTLAGRETAAL